MLPQSVVAQEVWTFTYYTEPGVGDCGAWVVDVQNEEFLGHIKGVGVSFDRGVAYFGPASTIFTDLQVRSGGYWSISEAVGSMTDFQAPISQTPFCCSFQGCSSMFARATYLMRPRIICPWQGSTNVSLSSPRMSQTSWLPIIVGINCGNISGRNMVTLDGPSQCVVVRTKIPGHHH